MPARTANLQIHTYRVRAKFGSGITKRTKGSAYLGYFERREFDGITRWHWSWAAHANQDRRAQLWVYNELFRLAA